MQRCNNIYNHPVYIKRTKTIAEKEKDRIFCPHNLSHALDVARIGYIMILEQGLDIDKELFYSAALLHDAGRYSDKPHNESGADLAKLIMPNVVFPIGKLNVYQMPYLVTDATHKLIFFQKFSMMPTSNQGYAFAVMHKTNVTGNRENAITLYLYEEKYNVYI